MSISNAFLIEQKTQLENSIRAMQQAALDIATGKIQQYSLNTGQTVESVTRLNLAVLDRVIDNQYARYATICARLGTSGMIGRHYG